MRTRPRLLWSATALALAGLLVAPGTGHAEPTWLSQVSTVWSGQMNDPALALDPSGTAVLVWSARSGDAWSVLAAHHPAGGDWSDPQQLSQGPRSTEPDVAVDDLGRAVAVWREATSTASVVRAMTYEDGAWGDRRTLSQDGQHAFQPQVAVSPRGQVAVAWTRNNADMTSAAQAVVGRIGGPWSATTLAGTGASSVDVGVADDGSAAAVWQQGGDVVAATRPSGHGWSSAGRLSTRPDSLDPSVVVDPAGNAVATWVASGFRDGLPAIQASSLRAGGGWTGAEDLTAPGVLATDVDLGLDADGEAVAAWVSGAGGDRTVQAGRRALDGTWTVTSVSGPGAAASAPEVAFGSGRTSVVLWTASPDPLQAGGLWAVTSGPTGRWSTPTDITRGDESAVPGGLAVDRDGNALVVWQSLVGDGTSHLRSRAFDGVGPALTTRDTRSAGRVGTPLRYTVRAQDAWSRVTRVTWAFSDGATARGRRVEHRFRRPGVYRVRVRATDSVGNSTTHRVPTVVADRAPGLGRLRVSAARARFRLAGPAFVRLRVIDRRTHRVVDAAIVTRAAGAGSVALHLPRTPGRYRVQVTAKNALGRSAADATVRVAR